MRDERARNGAQIFEWLQAEERARGAARQLREMLGDEPSVDPSALFMNFFLSDQLPNPLRNAVSYLLWSDAELAGEILRRAATRLATIAERQWLAILPALDYEQNAAELYMRLKGEAGQEEP